MTLTSFLRIALPIVGVALVGLGVVALAVGNPRMAPGREESESEVIEKEMEQAPQAVSPPRDTAVPGQIETATFALG